MSAQIDFLKRCKELGLHDGNLSDWLDEIEFLRQQLAECQEGNAKLKEAARVLVYNADEVMNFDECTSMCVCMEDFQTLEELLDGPQTCREDGRCQYAIDHGAEGMGHCPEGKCCMPHFIKGDRDENQG